MGFQPWPWDSTQAAVDWTWNHIRQDGDVISNHIEEGVPWPEALNNSAFPNSFQNLLTDRKNRSAGKKIILQLNPLNVNRDGLAGLRTDTQVNAPLSAPWNTKALNDPQVKTAYLNYVKRIVDLLQPEYIHTGIEVSILRRKVSNTVWAQYVDLQCSIYSSLKAAGYQQPIVVSFLGVAFYHPDQYSTEFDYAQNVQALRDLEPCVDVVGWSLYPYASMLLADSLPADYFSTVFSHTTKPQGVSETAYTAQVWSLYSLTWNGTQEKQRDMVEKLLNQVKVSNLKFVIWFTSRDYDQLWAKPVSSGGLGADDITLVWRDAGLYDENGNPRLAHQTWLNWLNQ